MTQNFNIDIISPSKSIFSSELSEATIPAYEGEMGVLKDHIPFITFLRPGLIEVLQDGGTQKFFVEDGVVEFSENKLLILSSTVRNLNEIDKGLASEIIEQSKQNLKDENIGDKQKYLLSYKIDALTKIIQ